MKIKKSTATTTFALLSMLLVMAKGGKFSYTKFTQSRNDRLNSDLGRDMTCDDFMQVKSRCCSCDSECLRYKNCCANKLWNQINDNDMYAYKKRLIAKAREYPKRPECKNLIPKNENFNGISRSYYMISTCENNTTFNDAKLCQGVVQDDLKTFIPVVGDDNYLYRNIHCARCNFVKEFSTVKINLYCVESNRTSSMQWCEILTEDKRVEECFPEFEPVKNCSTKNEFYDLCHTFKGPVGVYANYFCYLCNKEFVTSTRITTNLHCSYEPPPNPPFAWSSLLKFANSNSAVRKKDLQCQKDDIFDTLIDGCFPIICPAGYQPFRDKCVELTDVNPTFSTENANFDSCCVHRSLNLFILGSNRSTKVLENLQNLVIGNRNNTDIILSKKRDEMSTLIINAQIKNKTLNVLFKENSDHLLLLLKENEKLVISSVERLERLHSNLTLSHIFQGNRICAEPLALDIKNVSFDARCNIRHDGKDIMYWDASMQIQATINSITRHIYVCKRFYLKSSCPIRIISQNTSLNKNGTMVENRYSFTNTYEVHEYLPYSEGLFAVCIVHNEKVSSPVWLLTAEKVEGYMSSIGSGISILCYTVTLATFCLFKKLQNIPGFCTMGLCICLLISDGLFFTANMVRISNDEMPNVICKVIGILVHYFLLAAQLWGFIISLDFLLNMKKMSTNFHNKLKFYKYSVFAMILPIFIVATAMVLNNYRIIDIQYEENGICAMHGVSGRVIFMLMPILLSLLLSLVFITISILHLTKENKKNQNALSGSKHREVNMRLVALKMIILCGLPELIGSVQIDQSGDAVLIINTVLGFIYSIAKAFRGVFLLIVYVCRSLVFNLYRKRTQGNGNQLSSDNTNTSNVRNAESRK